MAVAKMKKLTLVAHETDKRKIMKALTGLGTVEVSESGDYQNAEKKDNAVSRAETEKKLARLNFVFSFLKEIRNQVKKVADKSNAEQKKLAEEPLDLKRENRLLDYDELIAEVTENEFDLFEIVGRLEEANSRLTDIRTEITRLNNLYAQVSEYSSFDIRFSQIKDTKYTAMFAGMIAAQNIEAVRKGLPASAGYETAPAGNGYAAVIIVHKEDKEAVAKLLAANDFSRCPFDFDETPAETLDHISERIGELSAAREELIVQSVGYFRYASDFKSLYDYYYLELAKLDALAKTTNTRHAFVMEAWVPADAEEVTVGKLKETAPGALIVTADPKEGETVPSYTRNSKIVGAFGENITALFGHPKYGGLDPNPFVALFYFIFFGFMLSDAGYGVLMTAACFIYLAVKKPVKRSGSFLLMFGLCGISTILWGAFFGGWFGIEPQYLEANSLGRFLLNFKVLDPLNGSQALVMFGLALGLGAVQIAAGFFLNGIGKLKTNPLDGIFNDFSWVILFLGMGIYLAGRLPAFAAASKIGLYIALAGVGMLVLGGMLGKKNPIKMLMGSFKNIYGIVGVFSDILSYARLFGLGLTTGVIAMVLNKIALIVIGMLPGIGYVFAVIVLAVGHAFNIFINLLGAYVHNSRLQYVEFFSKFYTGEGHAFNPLGGRTKYVFLSDKLETKSASR
jgi:V/A-type H+-transporting ATPase subunit I